MPDAAAAGREAFLVGGVRTPFGRYRGALAGVAPGRPRRDGARRGARAARRARRRRRRGHLRRRESGGRGQPQRRADGRPARRACPTRCPGYTVNRLCASGLQAVVSAAQQIRVGEADIVVAGGVESMTRAPMVVPKSDRPWAAAAEVADSTLGWRLVNPLMRDLDGGKATISLGDTAEEVAILDGITREESDAFGLRSQQLTAAAEERRARDLVAVVVGKDDRLRGRGAPPGHHRRGAGRAAARVPAGRHRHGRHAPRRSPTARARSSSPAGPRWSGSASCRARGSSPRPRRACRRTSWGSARCPSTQRVLERAGWADRRSRRGRDQRGLRDAGDREHPPARARSRRSSTPRAARSRSATRSARPGIRLVLTLLGRLERTGGNARARDALHRRRPGARGSGRAGLTGAPCQARGLSLVVLVDREALRDRPRVLEQGAAGAPVVGRMDVAAVTGLLSSRCSRWPSSQSCKLAVCVASTTT